MVNKTKPYVEISGKGPDLALLHGWGLHGGIWNAIVPELAKHFRVHNIDLPGFGYSRIKSNSEYRLDHVVEAVAELIPTNASIMGWSIGGLIATAIASSQKIAIRKLITVASSPCFTPKPNWPFGMRDEDLDGFIGELQKDHQATLLNFLSVQTMGSLTAKSDVKDLKKALFERGAPSLAALQGGLELLKNTDLRVDLKQIKIPFLRIYGKRDTLVPIDIAPQVSLLCPNSEMLVFEKSGHTPFISEKETFIVKLIDFLNSKVKAQ